MPEWSIGADCKSAALTGYPGSNPGLSTENFCEISSVNTLSNFPPKHHCHPSHKNKGKEQWHGNAEKLEKIRHQYRYGDRVHPEPVESRVWQLLFNSFARPKLKMVSTKSTKRYSAMRPVVKTKGNNNNPAAPAPYTICGT